MSKQAYIYSSELVPATEKADMTSPIFSEASHSETKKPKQKREKRSTTYLKILALIKREA